MKNFPLRSYDEDEQQNLAQIGFFPSGMLLIQLK